MIRRTIRIALAASLLLLLSACMPAPLTPYDGTLDEPEDLPGGTDDPVAVAEGYYATVDGLSGSELKAALNDVISTGLTRYDYAGVWTQLQYTDEDPANTANVFELYTGWSIAKTSNGGDVAQWNREHVWAKSHGDFGELTGPGTDLHHLRPADVTVNSKRGSLDFDEGGSAYTDPSPPPGVASGVTGCSVDSDSWEPRDEVKGDVARMMFYMAVMYEGEGGYDFVDLELNELVNNGEAPYIGRLSVLKAWHEADPVSDWERRRNERIFERQGNRNPFIDHPEWVGLIW